MRIGILLCEKFEAPRATCPEAPEYADEFLKMFKSAQMHSDMLGIETFYVKENQYPSLICDFDKYIITGSLASAYTNSGWILGLKQFCREAAVCGAKLIGICFGHQLLAEAFGGKVEPAKAGWGVGKRVSKLTGDNYLAKYFPRGEFVLEYSHHDQVVSPPTDSKILSSSSFCPIESLSIGNFGLTFQGHPEFDDIYAGMLFKFFYSQYSPKERSLRENNALLLPDNAKVARAILDF